MLRSPSSRLVRARLAVLASCLALGCGAEPARPNVLLVVVDTLRADRVGCYGAERDTTPNLDALARESVRYERAYAPSPWTLPSLATILTGEPPTSHGVRRPGHRLGPDVPTLATALRGAGYRTAAVVGNKIVHPASYGRGFEVWDQEEAGGPKRHSTEGLTARASALVGELAGEQPFFLYVHYMDPHLNYLPHEEAAFSTGPVGRLAGGEGWRALDALRADLTEEEIAYLRDLYDGEVRFTDAGIGALLAALREAGVAEETVVAVVSDHGEELMDHGDIGHAKTLHEEVLRVPLLVRPAGPRPVGTVVEEPVPIGSLAATLLELAGLAPLGGDAAPPLPPWGGPGEEPLLVEVDFVPAADAAVPVPRTWLRGLTDGRTKVVRDELDGTLALYDLEADPGERQDLAPLEPARAEAWARALDAALARAGTGAVPVEVELGEEELELLRGLGYAE